MNEQCSLYNLAVEGAYPCALEWWQKEDLGKVITVRTKMSKVVEEALSFQNLFKDANSSLYGKIKAESDDPLAKIIESALTVEPYIVYIVADLMEGYDITAEDLQKFGLSADIASKSKHKEMITDYFNYSCSRYLVETLHKKNI